MHKIITLTLIVLAAAGCEQKSRQSSIDVGIVQDTAAPQPATPPEVQYHPVLEPVYQPLQAVETKQITCLAHNMYFEARGESIDGQIAVALVTFNRVLSPQFPDNICGVVKQQRKTICQFSWWCDPTLRQRSINNKIATPEYKQIKQLATELYAMREIISDTTDGAIFYHANYVAKEKLGRMRIVKTAQIGKHIFYKQ